MISSRQHDELNFSVYPDEKEQVEKIVPKDAKRLSAESSIGGRCRMGTKLVGGTLIRFEDYKQP